MKDLGLADAGHEPHRLLTPRSPWCDWLNQAGAPKRAGRTGIFPAPAYTSFYALDACPPPRRDIRTTFMQKLPGITDNHQRCAFSAGFSGNRRQYTTGAEQ